MNLKIFIWLVILGWIWGPAFLFIKVAVHEIPPLTLMAIRVSVATAILYLFLRFQGRHLPRFGAIWKHFAVVGLVSSALPFALTSWGEQYIDSISIGRRMHSLNFYTVLLADGAGERYQLINDCLPGSPGRGNFGGDDLG
jgi:hypothetical protein